MSKRIKKAKKLRIDQSMTLADEARAASMQQGMIGWIESGRFIPYNSQLQKMAKALGYEGDPNDLLEEVDE